MAPISDICFNISSKRLTLRGCTAQKLLNPHGLTLVTRIEDPWLLLATLPLFHPVQALKMTPLLQFTPIHFIKSTPLLLFKLVCKFGALLGASFIKIKLQVLLRPGTPVL